MIDHRIKEQLALEFNCRPDDFDREDNVITKNCLHENRRKGEIPYYGTSLSNIFSWKIALGSGFAPAWIETESRPCNDNLFAK